MGEINEKTLLEGFAALGVNVNGLIVPGRSIQKVLQRHAFNLVVNNNDPTFKVSLVGSATAVRYQGRYLLLCTNHQLRGVDPQQVAMLLDDGSMIVTSGGFRSYAVSGETDAYDIAAFGFTGPVAAYPDPRRRFFDLSRLPPDTANINVLGVLLTGFPAAAQAYELEDKNHLGLAHLSIACLPDGQPADFALLRVRAQDPIAVDPDGMSGGSAFVIQSVDGDPSAYFAGIILQGGREAGRSFTSSSPVSFRHFCGAR